MEKEKKLKSSKKDETKKIKSAKRETKKEVKEDLTIKKIEELSKEKEELLKAKEELVVEKEQLISNKEQLTKKNKKLKIACIILAILIFIGGSSVCVVGYSYINRKVFPFSKVYNAAKEINKDTKIKVSEIPVKDRENYHNAANRLKIVSSYGDNQGTHPKVLYFKDGWNGYKYWMVYSPYPFSDDSKENPHIKVSNDLVNWSEPKGFENPLADTPSDYENMVIYNSDPHIVYNDDKDELECYWRRVDDKKDEGIIYRRTTKDGVHWTDREEVLKDTRSEHDYVSFAIIYDKGTYRMWYVNKNNTVTYEESKDGYNYENRRVIDLKYENRSMKTWHLDVIKSDIGYEMIAVAFESWEGRKTMQLYYSSSEDNENWEIAKPILKASNTGWDNGGMYRSSFIKVDGIYYVYYSGVSKEFARGIGLSYGSNIFNLKGYAGKIEK